MVVEQESYPTGTPALNQPENATPPDGFPLSAAQELAWFLEQLQPGAAGQHVLAAWQLSGPLDTAALQQSANRVIGRPGQSTGHHLQQNGPVGARAGGA